MDDTAQKHGKEVVIPGMEPTGHYWFSLGMFLQENGMRPVHVNPHHVKKSNELDDNNPSLLPDICIMMPLQNMKKAHWMRIIIVKFAKQYEEQVVLIDQSAITATGRSTVCTFLGFFDEIRKVFAAENKADAGLFSFNSKGACPHCKGRGMITTELVFMEPVTTVCEHCNGSRYSDESLEHLYKGKTKPTTGLHIADIENVVDILESIVDRGNTVVVIEHNTDVMKLADYIIDVGPDGGSKGGEIVFTGTPKEMFMSCDTITARYLRKSMGE